MIFFTADQHFYHENIIKYCNRPFRNMEEMNEELIKKWNEAISPIDHVYVIGDFVLGRAEKQVERLVSIVKQLKGHIF